MMAPLCKLWKIFNSDFANPGSEQQLLFNNCDSCTLFEYYIFGQETIYVTSNQALDIIYGGGPLIITDLGLTTEYANFSGHCSQSFSLLVDPAQTEFGVGDIFCFSGFTGCTGDVNQEYAGGCYKLIDITASPTYTPNDSLTVLPYPSYSGTNLTTCVSTCPCPDPSPTPTPTPTQTQNFSVTPTPTQTQNFVATPTPTQTSNQTPTPTPTQTPTISITPSITPTISLTPTNTPTPSTTPIPPTPTATPKPINECDVITIFQMGISCVAQEPTTSSSNDGAVSLFISGGTPPYTITWGNGNIAPAIGNLSIGSYPVTVVDSWGDFTASTVCYLTGQTIQPTPTPTPTQTLPLSGPKICMTVDVQEPSPLYFQQTFTNDSYLFGKQSWISDDAQYRIFWTPLANPDVWILSGATLGCQIINTNPASPPLNNNWQVLGCLGTTTVTIGECNTEPMELSPYKISNPNINLYAVKSDTICGCEGSIVANADGGNPPYQYSVDGGLIYKNFPIFNDLCAGNYTVTVKDYSGYTKSSQITINEPLPQTNYLVNLNVGVTNSVQTGTILTKNYEVTLNVTPPLPETASITFDLIHFNNFETSTTMSSATMSTNTILTIDEIPEVYSYLDSFTGESVNTINGCQNQTVYYTGTSEAWQNITLYYNNNLKINTSTSVTKNFTTGCDIGVANDYFSIANLSIAGCNCCSITNLTI